LIDDLQIQRNHGASMPATTDRSIRRT
jgi:hypothetical protein